MEIIFDNKLDYYYYLLLMSTMQAVNLPPMSATTPLHLELWIPLQIFGKNWISAFLHAVCSTGLWISRWKNVYLRLKTQLAAMTDALMVFMSRILTSGFFHESSFPRLLIRTVFQILNWKEIHSPRCTTGINDIGGHIFPEIYSDSGNTGSLTMSITILATNGNGKLCHNGKTCFCDSKSETLEIDLTGTVSRDRFGFWWKVSLVLGLNCGFEFFSCSNDFIAQKV